MTQPNKKQMVSGNSSHYSVQSIHSSQLQTPLICDFAINRFDWTMIRMMQQKVVLFFSNLHVATITGLPFVIPREGHTGSGWWLVAHLIYDFCQNVFGDQSSIQQEYIVPSTSIRPECSSYHYLC